MSDDSLLATLRAALHAAEVELSAKTRRRNAVLAALHQYERTMGKELTGVLADADEDPRRVTDYGGDPFAMFHRIRRSDPA